MLESINNIGIFSINSNYLLNNIGENKPILSSVNTLNSQLLKDLANSSINNDAILSLNYSLDGLNNYSKTLYSNASDLESFLINYQNTNNNVTQTGNSVSYTENGDLKEGEYDVSINQLATGEIISSNAVIDPNAALGQTGNFVIDGFQVNVISSDSLMDIANKINSSTTETIASVENNKLVLKDASTGTLATIQIQNNAGDGFQSTDTNVAITDTLLQNTEWGHDINVTQLSETMEVASDVQFSTVSSLGLNGQFKINGTIFNVTSDMTLTDIQNLINNGNIGITASIIDNTLHIISNTEGALGVFSIEDIVTAIGPHSTNPDVAVIDTVLSDTNWSKDVEVVQLAQDNVFYNNDFSNSSLTDFSFTSGGSWSVTNGELNVSHPKTKSAIAYLNGTDSLSNNRTVSVDFESVSGKTDTGIVVSYNSDHYLDVGVSNDGRMTLYYNDNTGLENSADFYFDPKGNTKLNLEVTTDDSGNVLMTVKDMSGNILTQENVNMSSFIGKSIDFSGKIGLLSNIQSSSDPSPTNPVKTFDNLKVVEHQKAVYKVDGIQYISSTNDNVSLIDSATGENLALIDLIGVGQTTLSNTVNPVTNPTGPNSTNPNVATIDTVLSDTNWSEGISVQQLAQDVVAYQNDFSSGSLNDFTHDATWSINNGEITATHSNTTPTRAELIGSDQFSSNRTVSADMTLNDNPAALMLSRSSIGYLELGIDDSGHAYLWFYDKTTGLDYNQNFYFDLKGNTNIRLEATTDDQGNISFTVKDPTGNILTNQQTSMTQLAGKNVDLTGTVGLVSTASSTNPTVTNSFDNFTVIEHKEAIYTVNGNQYTSNTNDNISLFDTNSGIELAKIDLHGVGQTTLSNTTSTSSSFSPMMSVESFNTTTSSSTKTTTDAIMAFLGVLDNTGSYKNLLSQAQDASYSIDGTQYTNSSNNNILLKDINGNDEASIDLTGIGTTTVSNHLGGILTNLGILDNSGNKINILQNAEDASYSINGHTYQSDKNFDINTNFGLTLTLTSAGDSHFYIGKETNLSNDSYLSFTSQYNHFVSFLNKNKPFISEVLLSRTKQTLQKNLSNFRSFGMTIHPDGTIDMKKFKANKNNIKLLQNFIKDVKDLSFEVFHSPFGTFSNSEFLQNIYQQIGINYQAGSKNSGLLNKKF
jgi:hypothetical protein